MDTATIDLQHKFYDMLMRSQYWSAERLRDYQRSQIEQLLHHARKNVPFYEKRLDPVFTPSGDIDWERWGEIPLVRRSDLGANRQAMLATEIPPGHGAAIDFRTSGSTGPQMTVTVNEFVNVIQALCLWRSHTWHGIDWSRNIVTRRGEDPKVAAWPEGRHRGRWGAPWADSSTGQSYEVNRATTLAQLLEIVERKQAGYITMGSKPAMTLALEAEKSGSTVRLDAILAHGEGVGALEREICQRALGARIIELYSSREGSAMAHPCPVSESLHINAECILVEVLDDDNRPCLPGEVGHVVITPFYSTAQPLIRYDQGDLAVAGSPCTCGRHLPTLGKIQGRVMTFFFHPDGRAVARTFPEKCRTLLGAGPWQIAQTAAKEFEVRYVPLDWNEPGDEQQVRDVFRAHYFEDAMVQFKRYVSLPLSASGKAPEYVNEWRLTPP